MEDAMQISDIMSPNVQLASPDQSIREIAQIMAGCDCGAVPVGDTDRLVGIVTDRDIAVRAGAGGKAPGTPGSEGMSRGVPDRDQDRDSERAARHKDEHK